MYYHEIQKEFNNFMDIKKFFTILRLFLSFLMLLSVMACFLAPSARKFDSQAFLKSQESKIDKSAQILLAVDNSSFFFTKTTLYTMEKQKGIWQAVLEPFDAVAGEKGFAKQGEKKEGDGKTPSGIYPLKTAFGYESTVKTKMPYRQASADDVWVDDPESPDYNHWVKKQDTHAASFELMKRNDNLYKLGVVIEYNTDPVIKGYGSAIFLHIWKGEGITTAGCVAVSEENIVKILEWLDPAASPLIITGIRN